MAEIIEEFEIDVEEINIDEIESVSDILEDYGF